MAFVEVHHYRSYFLEVREYGDGGWAVHVYQPLSQGKSEKLKVVATTDAAALEQVLTEAKAAVDKLLGIRDRP